MTAAVVRGLAIDAVEESGTGHPGMPLGNADFGAVLFSEILRHFPSNPHWMDRDRFVLSAGHGSVWLYSLLHLCGYDLPLAEIKRLRRLGSKTPGHPEYGLTDGVECTTGPLGAGFATAVGMAMAEARLAAEFNRPGHRIIDHFTYVLSGDGCLMEGVTAEAASLAGHQGLGKLIVFYDSNAISIEGNTSITFTEDVRTRFAAYGWQTLSGSSHDPAGILELVRRAKSDLSRPTLIELESTIGKGSPAMAGSHKVHGALLGAEEIKETKKAIGLPPDESFFVSPDVKEYLRSRAKSWGRDYATWQDSFAAWSERYPDLRRRLDGYYREAGFEIDSIDFPEYAPGSGRSTRDVSGDVLSSIAAAVPNFMGGSADLSHSNKSEMPGHGEFSSRNRLGRTIRFGVREHAMGSIQNGLLLHGGLRTFVATLFVFVDYMRPAMRLAALMEIPAIYVLTHDSIYLGGDGPTHQPIEHLNSLRIIPNMRVLRPSDPEEAVECWKMALERTDGPTCLVFSRQALTTEPKADSHWRESLRASGAYILRQETGAHDVTVLATGSEVGLAMALAEELSGDVGIRVVSVASRELLAEATSKTKAAILGSDAPVVVVEAGSRCGWEQFTAGNPERILSIDRFGESGRGEEVAEHLGLTLENLRNVVKKSSRGVAV